MALGLLICDSPQSLLCDCDMEKCDMEKPEHGAPIRGIQRTTELVAERGRRPRYKESFAAPCFTR